MSRRSLPERKIEDYLTEEVRSLPMPDGSERQVRAFRLLWKNYDIILQHGSLSALEISALALFWSEKQGGLRFEDALSDILKPLRKHANEIIDIKLSVLGRKSGGQNHNP